MPITLSEIWPIANLTDYKIHFARWNHHIQPLEVWAQDSKEWKGWQEYRPERNEFNRNYIFSLMQFYHENNSWLFGGVYQVLARHPDRYEVELMQLGEEFIGRLKLGSDYTGRTARVKFENHYAQFEVLEILREPYSGKVFPGYQSINISFHELETIVLNDRADWKVTLENAKGIYLISDDSTGKRYVGSAYGDQGIWGRWSQYIANGHGSNLGLDILNDGIGIDYYRRNLKFALLQYFSEDCSTELILQRELYWKSILLTRSHGLNLN